MRNEMNRIQSKYHNIGSYRINKISLSVYFCKQFCNIRLIIRCYLLKFPFVRHFHDTIIFVWSFMLCFIKFSNTLVLLDPQPLMIKIL